MSYTGGDRAEFGIIETINPKNDYGSSYEPEKYSCVAICEEAINDWYDELADMKTYWHCMNRPNTNIARYGVTIIPPESLEQLIGAIRAKTKAKFAADALEVASLLETAAKLSKFVILYDV